MFYPAPIQDEASLVQMPLTVGERRGIKLHVPEDFLMLLIETQAIEEYFSQSMQQPIFLGPAGDTVDLPKESQIHTSL